MVEQEPGIAGALRAGEPPPPERAVENERSRAIHPGDMARPYGPAKRYRVANGPPTHRLSGSARPAMPGQIRPAFSRVLVEVLAAAGRQAVGLVYPPTCIACGAAAGEPHAMCGRCWSRMRFIERPFCERLGTPFAAD